MAPELYILQRGTGDILGFNFKIILWSKEVLREDSSHISHSHNVRPPMNLLELPEETKNTLSLFFNAFCLISRNIFDI